MRREPAWLGLREGPLRRHSGVEMLFRVQCGCDEIRSDVSAASVCSLNGVTFSEDGMGSRGRLGRGQREDQVVGF